MTDDISKVVRRFRGTGELERDGYIPAGSAIERDRPKSAAAPAEVGEVESLAAYLEGEAGWSNDRTGQELQVAANTLRTLARQLAEAKAEIAAHERNDIAETDLIHSFLQRLEQAESALAAATRRLGEVEGLVGKWREEAPGTQSSYDIHNRYGDALENCADELEAALKEPK